MKKLLAVYFNVVTQQNEIDMYIEMLFNFLSSDCKINDNFRKTIVK